MQVVCWGFVCQKTVKTFESFVLRSLGQAFETLNCSSRTLQMSVELTIVALVELTLQLLFVRTEWDLRIVIFLLGRARGLIQPKSSLNLANVAE